MADDVRRFFEVNTLSTFVCCQHAGLILPIKNKAARSSNRRLAVERPYRRLSAYFVSKAPSRHSHACSPSSSPPKVRVNAVLPAPSCFPKASQQRTPPRHLRPLLGRRPPRKVAVPSAALPRKRLSYRRLPPRRRRRTLGETGLNAAWPNHPRARGQTISSGLLLVAD